MHCITDCWQSYRVWEQQTLPSPAAIAASTTGTFQTQKLCITCLKQEKTDVCPVFATWAWTLGSVKTRVLCLGCCPSLLWIWVQTAWDAQIPQVNGTCWTCWRLSHLFSDKRSLILCAPGWTATSSLHTTLIRGNISEIQGIKNELKVLTLPLTLF